MGTYVWYSGAADYPLEKRKRIKENILKMLDAGGMMQIESVKNNNHELYVLSKPEKDQNNRILWNFNYFEDDMWETASLDCKDLQIYSNKVGNEEYKDVMIALYMFRSWKIMISDSPCAMEILCRKKNISDGLIRSLELTIVLGKDLIYGKMWCGILRMKNVKRCI